MREEGNWGGGVRHILVCPVPLGRESCDTQSPRLAPGTPVSACHLSLRVAVGARCPPCMCQQELELTPGSTRGRRLCRAGLYVFSADGEKT